MYRIIYIAVLSLLVNSCVSYDATPIKLNSDACDFCKMTISNGKFGAELITEKGREYKFDDLTCLIQYAKSNTTVPYAAFYVNDFSKNNELIAVENSFFLKGGTINSPMRGNFAAFSSQKEQLKFQSKFNATPMGWKEVYASHK